MYSLLGFLEDKKIKFFKEIDITNQFTIRIKAQAELFVLPDTQEKLIALIDYLSSYSIDFSLIGRGSNVLPVRGKYNVIVSTKKLNGISLCGAHVSAQAGVSMPSLAKYTMQHSLSGFEELSGIPGSVGGMIRMNAGAYGKTISDFLVSCNVYDAEAKKCLTFSKQEMCLEYRKSIFEHNSAYTLISADFLLLDADICDIRCKMDLFKKKRNQSQPTECFSLGSVFMRNPCEPAPAYLIEQAGLKGLTVGGIQVSTKHSGFFINLGYGSAKDFLLLADIVKKRINTLYGVKLNEEYKEL